MDGQTVIIYDTTLRDGTQGGGVSFSVEDKLRIARRLNEFRIDYIEGGWPGSNPRDIEFFQRAQSLNLSYSRIAAFGSTRKKNTKPENDENLRLLLSAKTPVITIFGKSDTLHVSDALGATLEENLLMISDSVAYLKEHGRVELIYDAEHFFDGFKRDPDYALKTLSQAISAGADFIVLCDTNGGTDFYGVQQITSLVKRKFPHTRLGIHTHNDMEYAVANSYAAVVEGVEMVQGTINGIGERVGNANLVTIIANLSKGGYKTAGDIDLRELTSLSRFVDELTNLLPNKRQPYVGKFAFAHKGGIHVDAVLKNSHLYEHTAPESVGNSRDFLVSDLAGTSHIEALLGNLGIKKRDPLARQIVEEIKRREHEGYSYEAANGSLDLLVRNIMSGVPRLFDLVEYRAGTEKTGDGKLVSSATVRIRVNGNEITETRHGNGPVNALDLALRSALTRKYPGLNGLELEDYEVRIIPGEKRGTADRVRVLIESKIDNRRFGTVGVSENIIDASWQALVDGFIYAHLQTLNT